MADKANQVHEYELDEDEWEITEQLCDVLKVRRICTFQWPITLNFR